MKAVAERYHHTRRKARNSKPYSRQVAAVS